MGLRAALGRRRRVPNFPDPDLDEWAPAYHGANLDRLRRVTASYDPDGFFARPLRPERLIP